jgi:hypothetical protein
MRSIAQNICSAGILTCCPSTTPFDLALGPTNPPTTTVAEETLGFRRPGFSPGFLLLMPTFSLPNAPRSLAGTASQQLGMLLYHSLYKYRKFVSSVLNLAPYIFGAKTLDR